MGSGTPYLNIARVGKTRGKEGKVAVHCTDGLPLCLYEGLEVHIVPPSLYGVRTTTLEEVSVLGDGTCTVRLQGVSSIAAAEELTGKYLLALREDLDVEPEEIYDELVGRPVNDQRYGLLGSVVEIIETPANDVIVVSGQYGEVLIPWIEQVILDVPEDPSQPICTCVMDGLVSA